MQLQVRRGGEVCRPPRWRRRRPGRPGGCGRPGPGGPRSCGSRSRRTARPADSLSGFMARHIEQPGSRHSKPAVDEHLVQALGLGLGLRPGASRARPGPAGRRRTRRPSQHGGRRAQVLDARVGARADEHGVHADVAHRRAGARGPCSRGPARPPPARPGSAMVVGVGHRHRRSATTWAGIGAPGHVRADGGRVERDLLVERGARRRWRACASRRRAASQSAPCGRVRPSLAGRRTSSRRGRSCPARAPASIDMLQTVIRPSMDSDADGRAPVLDDVAHAAAGADACR